MPKRQKLAVNLFEEQELSFWDKLIDNAIEFFYGMLFMACIATPFVIYFWRM